ncbi:MAG: hypothetical protein IJ092_13025 [Atopobiaceae bacterium]|nr:hypothetical protein [Atopobiaceae bacterium]MBR1829616.1 hypothetical protein [Atopobiaceae bacterium]
MAHRKQGVSRELDELSSTLVGDALDLLAEGSDVNTLLVVQDAKGSIASFEFADDDPDALLEAAHDRVKELVKKHGDSVEGIGEPIRYALVYEGMVAANSEAYQDALMLEFGEKGWYAYSAYSLYEGKGAGDGFAWTDPAPAGEIEPLI